jgi:hypothetical protein
MLIISVYFNSFGGMGAIISYSDTMENETVDAASTSEVLSIEVGLKTDTKFIIGGPGFTIAAEIGYVGERETSTSTELSQVKARSRSFSLGDADDGDVFDVQVSRSWVVYPSFAQRLYQLFVLFSSCVFFFLFFFFFGGFAILLVVSDFSF